MKPTNPKSAPIIFFLSSTDHSDFSPNSSASRLIHARSRRRWLRAVLAAASPAPRRAVGGAQSSPPVPLSCGGCWGGALFSPLLPYAAAGSGLWVGCGPRCRFPGAGGRRVVVAAVLRGRLGGNAEARRSRPWPTRPSHIWGATYWQPCRRRGSCRRSVVVDIGGCSLKYFSLGDSMGPGKELFYTGGQLLPSPVMVCGMHCAFAIKGLPAEVAANQIVEIEATIMPHVYRYKIWVLCNDCNKVSEVNFHVIGNKCSHYRSYNTRSTSHPADSLGIIVNWPLCICELFG